MRVFVFESWRGVIKPLAVGLLVSATFAPPALASGSANICGTAIAMASAARDAENECHEPRQSEELAAAAISCMKTLGWHQRTVMQHADEGSTAWDQIKTKYGLQDACARMDGVADKTYDTLFGEH